MVQAIILLIWVYNCVTCTCYLILASLLDAEFKERNIHSYYYGLIIGCYGLFLLIAAPLPPIVVNMFGRSKTMYIGIISSSICLSLMGLITYVEDNGLMIATGMLLRGGQGFCRIFTVVLSRVIILCCCNNQAPEMKFVYLGLFEAFMNLRTCIGPVVGIVLYKLFGFVYMFVIIGLFHLIFLPLMFIFMPNDIDSDNQETVQLIKNEHSGIKQVPRINIYTLIFDPLILLLCISELISALSSTYYEPLLSFRLAELTDSDFISSSMFFLYTVGMLIMCIFIMCLQRIINPFNMIILGLLTCGLFNFLVGPSTLFPNSLVLLAIGLFFSGATMILCSVPQLSMMSNHIEIKYCAGAHQASDSSSNIYTFVYSAGQSLGPICGGVLNHFVGYRTCCDIFAITLIASSVGFYAIGRRYSEPPVKFNPDASQDTKSDINFRSFASSIQNLNQ